MYNIETTLINKVRKEKMLKYKNKNFSGSIDLMYALWQEQGDDFDQSPIPSHTIMNCLFAFREKFPNIKWTPEKVKKILAEELALKTITLYEGASQRNAKS